MSEAVANHSSLMDGVYKTQRHIYDVTRKYYLLGRDQLVDDLKPASGQTVLEVGCGTARNLIVAAKKYPSARFYGFDISTEMLITARKNIEKAGLTDRITLTEGDASSFSGTQLFGLDGFDRVFCSYTLSMIPPWQAAIDQAMGAVNTGGSFHIVDFGTQDALPGWFKPVLHKWLELFHVEPRKDLASVTRDAAARHAFSMVKDQAPYRGYAHALTARRIEAG